MHPSTKRAYELLDRLKAAPQQPVVDDSPVRHEVPEMVYKRYEPRPAPLPQKQNVMLAAEQEQWDRWVQAHIAIATDETKDFIGNGIAIMFASMRKEWRGEVDKLRLQVEALQTELNVAKGQNITRLVREAG